MTNGLERKRMNNKSNVFTLAKPATPQRILVWFGLWLFAAATVEETGTGSGKGVAGKGAAEGREAAAEGFSCGWGGGFWVLVFLGLSLD